jgi:GR25 family glycosyltransferase involved in LPS biosynthesis
MKGYYINLDHRTDRNSHIQQNIVNKYELFSQIERMSAIKNENGAIGCSMSHIKCLTKCLEMKDEPYFMILEDDFCVLNEKNMQEFMKEFEKIKYDDKWDVIVLTPIGSSMQMNYIQKWNRIKTSQTTTGYIIKASFVPILIEICKHSVENLLRDGDPNEWALDQAWKPLQMKHAFICFYQIYAGQIPGYSDIEKRHVNYNRQFTMQKI